MVCCINITDHTRVIYTLDKKKPVRNGLDTGGILNAKFMGGGGG